MIELEYEMTYAETIDGPVGPTTGSPAGERLCWQVTHATLDGPRIHATLAMAGIDWIRIGSDGIRRPDLRVQMMTDDGHPILFRYDVALIRSGPRFLAALAACRRPSSTSSTCESHPSSKSPPDPMRGSARACSSVEAGSPDTGRSRMSCIAFAEIVFVEMPAQAYL